MMAETMTNERASPSYQVNQILKLLGPAIRRLGFKGAGQTYRRVEDDNVFVINLQFSRARNVFYANLGAQPTFTPALGGAELATLKEYACVMRTRVGRDWPLDLDEEGVPPLVREIDDKQRDFFGRARPCASRWRQIRLRNC